jgi:hypothetical protein
MERKIVHAIWRTSSFSGSNGGNCVEVAATDHVLVRDTKDHGTGPVLAFGHAAWTAFTKTLKG